MSCFVIAVDQWSPNKSVAPQQFGIVAMTLALLLLTAAELPAEVLKFGPERKGLAAVLAGRANSEAVVPVPGFTKLSLLPAGILPPNAQDLLSRPLLAALLKKSQIEFDVVLIDTPAARLYSDAQSVTFQAGSAVLLARKNHTQVTDTKQLLRELSDTGTRVVGTVMNSF